MQDIPLKVLIVDPDAGASEALRRVLEQLDVVFSVERAPSLDRAAEVLQQREINTIYIDPVALGIEAAGGFVFGVRRSHPRLVFVLYFDIDAQRRVKAEFYSGERARFKHYFRLGKRAIGPRFVEDVRKTVNACQDDLRYRLAQEKIVSLRKEVATIQANASEETASVPLKILKEIQEQLRARQRETKAVGELAPADFLGPAASSVKYDRCFVVMPYSEPWSKGVESVLKESCQAAGVEFTIAKTMEARYVPHDIWQGISGSGIVIADLTGANANVTYELGLADAIGREVIIICQGTKVPFDFLAQRLLLYENSVSGGFALRNDLIDRLKKIKDRCGAKGTSDGDQSPSAAH